MASTGGIIRPISSAARSGRIPRSTFLTPVSASTLTCERFTVFMGEPTLYIIDGCSAVSALTA